MDIQVNPYEIARLARRLGQTTREFRATWTRDGLGTTLEQTATGACVFLGRDGCRVHADRPLVCRLYPLGRHVDADGSERFSHIEPHPLSAGEYRDKGTIADFVASQGAEPFLRAADAYFAWLCAAATKLGAGEDGNKTQREGLVEQRSKVDGALKLLDMDECIARHCRTNGLAEPDNIEERMKLHLAILYEEIAASPQEPKP